MLLQILFLIGVVIGAGIGLFLILAIISVFIVSSYESKLEEERGNDDRN